MDMAIVNDVTSSMNAMHLSNNNEWMETRMEVDHWAPTQTEHVDDMDIKMIEGERETYEIYVDFCSDDAVKAMEIYSSILSEVVGGHENAILQLLASNKHCFLIALLVNLTGAELEKTCGIKTMSNSGNLPSIRSIIGH
ncbi:hypothetical protein Tco_1226452 [Tanacetum coccineum]